MPALPKFADAAGLVGRVEVLSQGEAHPKRDSNGNVGVSAEVGIDLHGVGKQTKGILPARVKCGLAKNSVDQVNR